MELDKLVRPFGVAREGDGEKISSLFDHLPAPPPSRRALFALTFGAYQHLASGGVFQGVPPWSRVEGKSQVNFPQMPPLRGGICMKVDLQKHPFAHGLPPGRRAQKKVLVMS